MANSRLPLLPLILDRVPPGLRQALAQEGIPVRDRLLGPPQARFLLFDSRTGRQDPPAAGQVALDVAPLRKLLPEDPFEALTESYFAMPPCTTRDSAVEDHIDYLVDKASRTDARGVIFLMVKFCEPELFDVPQVVEGLKEKGLATLLVECEMNQAFSGQLVTRLEAFVETIG